VSALSAVELARTFTDHAIPAGVVGQVASVVRTAGSAKVALLGAGVLSDPDAGRVVLAHLNAGIRAGRSDEALAHELELAADLQRFAGLSFPGGAGA